MKTNTSLRQFVKDGLVSVAVVLVIFVIIAILEFRSMYSPENFFKYFLPQMIFYEMYGNEILPGPMPFVILTAFIGIGIGGRFLETIPTTRKEWDVAVLKISGISWLAGVALSVIYGIFHFFAVNDWVDIMDALDSFGFMVLPFIIGDAIGAFLSTIIAGVAWIIFRPQKRLYRIIIGALSSTLVGYGGGVIWLLLLNFATN